MEKIIMRIEAEINPTETEPKVREAIEKMFGPMTLHIKSQPRKDLIRGETSNQDALVRFHNLLQREHIRAAARATLLQGINRNTLSFCLNKQVAYAGHVSFSQEQSESPLGPIRVKIESTNPKEIVDYLTHM